MEEKERSVTGSTYFNQGYYNNGKTWMLNVIASTTLAMFDYFESFLFNMKTDKNPSNRIVFSKNEFAFRERLRDQRKSENSELQANTLNMPFMNFGISSISLSDSRLMASYYYKNTGIYLSELGKKFRFFPVEIQYEGTFFTTSAADAQIVLAKFFKQASTQTILKPVLYYDGKEIANFAELNFSDVTYDGEYSESDWLEKNRIHTVGFNISVMTYFIDTDPGIDAEEGEDDYWLTKKIILDFSSKLAIKKGSEEETLTATVDHILQQVDW